MCVCVHARELLSCADSLQPLGAGDSGKCHFQDPEGEQKRVEMRSRGNKGRVTDVHHKMPSPSTF